MLVDTHTSGEEVEVSDVEGGAVATMQSLRQNESFISNADGDAELWSDDGSIFYESNGLSDIACDLDREWQRRREGFHAIGYRDGLTAGKDASAQEGFNNGFKQYVVVGYRWGLVRGVTSALVSLPNDVKQKLVETMETRDKLLRLFERVRSVSSQQAMSEYHADDIARESMKQSDDSDRKSPDADKCKETNSSILEMYTAEFESLKLGLRI